MAVLDLGKVVPEKGVDYFTESDVNQIVDDVVGEITIPTKVSQLENDSEFIDKTANNLTYYTLATNTGSTIELSINSTTYVMTMNLKNAAGTVISTGSVDLPLESVVVNGSYDSTNKKIVLTLQSGSTIDVPVGDLVSGLQSEITSSNKLDSDLVDDTNKTNKFVTSTDKTNWNAKYDKPSGGIPSTDLSSAVQTSLGKADSAIQDISGKQDLLVSGTNIKTVNNTSLLGSGNIEISGSKIYIIPYYSYTDSSVVTALDEAYQAFLQGNNLQIYTQLYSNAKIINVPLFIKETNVNYLHLVSDLYIDPDSGGVNYDRGYTVNFRLNISNGHISSVYGRTIKNVDVSSSDGKLLKHNNTFVYTPAADSYNPATAKYAEAKALEVKTQFSTMPTASVDNVGQIVQFIGTTDSTYTNGYFYQCVSDGAVTPTYSWENIDVQASSGGGGLPKYKIDGDFITYFVKPDAYGINVISATSQTTVNLPQTEINEAITLAINNNKKLCLYICDVSNIHSVLFMSNTVPPASGTTLELLGRFAQGSGNIWIAILKLTYTYTNNTVSTTNKKITGRTLCNLGTINENTFEPNYDSYNPATAKYAEQMTLPVAPKYSKTTSYAVGDYVTQYNELYVCKTAIPSGENWNSSHWTKTNVVSIIGNLETALSNITTGNGV